MTLEEMRRIKKEEGFTNEQISRFSGIPLGTIQKIFAGTTESPRFETLQSLQRFFLVHRPELCGQFAKEAPGTSRDAGSSSGSETAASGYVLKQTSPVVKEPGIRYGGSAAAAAALSGKKPGEYTLEDYLALPDEIRVELIDGVFYDMAGPTNIHQLIAGEIYALLRSYILSRKGSCIPFIAPTDVQLDRDDKTIVEPDVMVVCDRSKINRLRIFGAPDFVVEILSPSSKTKDMVVKMQKYQNAGVREYWVVDPDKKRVLVWRFEDDLDLQLYGFDSSVPVGIFGGEFTIDFAQIYDYIRFLYEDQAPAPAESQ